jgi:hypothetical protein
MGAVMTRRADHEGFASPFGHELGPCRLWLPRRGEVGELADLVNLHTGSVLAHLAPAGPEPADQLGSFPLAGGDWQAVGDDRPFLLP